MSLYHYTSVDVLASILRNNAIRFSSLSRMDDPDEVQTVDFDNIGRFLYASCWTNIKDESIPQWSMYSNGMKGVRIELSDERPNCIFQVEKRRDDNGDLMEVMPLLFDSKEYTVSPPYIPQLIKMKYTDDKEKLFPKVYIRTETATGYEESIMLNDIGKYKRNAWSFQHEVRFVFTAVPWERTKELIKLQENLLHNFNGGLNPGDAGYESDTPINRLRLIADKSFMDVPLSDNVTFKIVAGPKCSDGQLELLQLLKEKYSRIESVKLSKLMGHIV